MQFYKIRVVLVRGVRYNWRIFAWLDPCMHIICMFRMNLSKAWHASFGHGPAWCWHKLSTSLEYVLAYCI